MRVILSNTRRQTGTSLLLPFKEGGYLRLDAKGLLSEEAHSAKSFFSREEFASFSNPLVRFSTGTARKGGAKVLFEEGGGKRRAAKLKWQERKRRAPALRKKRFHPLAVRVSSGQRKKRKE